LFFEILLTAKGRDFNIKTRTINNFIYY